MQLLTSAIGINLLNEKSTFRVQLILFYGYLLTLDWVQICHFCLYKSVIL